MGADGKRSRALSAGYLDRGDMSLLRRPASRNVLTKEWIVSMKQKGVIISDAEMRLMQHYMLLTTKLLYFQDIASG